MPLIDVDDTVLAGLRSAGASFTDRTATVSELEKFHEGYAKILNSPNRLELLRLLKKQYPDLAIPELDAASPVLDRVDALAKTIDEKFAQFEEAKKKDEDESREKSAKNTVATGRKALRAKGFDDEGVEAIEKIMRDNNIANYDIAVAYFESTQPKPVQLPDTYTGNNLDWFKPDEGDVDHKLLLEDPNKWKNQQIKKIFEERAAAKAA